MLRLAASVALLAWFTPATANLSPTTATIEKATQDTAAISHIFQDWLVAFNSSDPAVIKAFYGKYLGDPNPVFAIESAEDTCGLTVERIFERLPTSMTVLLRQRCLPGLQRAKIELEIPDGSKLKTLEVLPLALPGDGPISAAAAITGRLAARDAFAGSLIVVRGDRLLLARSYGLADPAAKTKITRDTPMFLASAGKMFTAVAVLQLVDAGKVELDAPLGKYLTDYPNKNMAKVTVRQLLTHRGGTGDIGILGLEDGANRARVKTIDDIVQLNGLRPPDFPPGSKEDYSNYGFILLGAVIERVTGISYYDYVAEHVFKPAGMKNASFPDHQHLQDVAVGYTSFYGAQTELVPNLDVLPQRGASAGGGVASANDMLKFFQALKVGRLLSSKTLKLATTPGDTPWYGLGFVAQSGERASWGHGGNSYGMDVALHTYAKNGTTFICMAARDSVCNRIIFAWYLRTFGPAK